jgi:hypothetical protein
VLDSRKQLFEDLLWEHRELSDAHASLQVSYKESQGKLLISRSHYAGIFFKPDYSLTKLFLS